MAAEGFITPASFAQQRLWFLDQLEQGNPFYNLTQAIRMVGRLSVGALEQALQQIVDRHESLRTSFVAPEGEPLQVITSSARLELGLIDVSRTAEGEREQKAREAINAESQQAFDLSRGPLLRARLVRLDSQHHILVLVMHHIISDGWSIGVLYRELAALYEAICEGKACELANLPIQYADYAVWQREWLSGAVLDNQLGYWKRQLEGAPGALELPTDRPRPIVQSYRGGRLSKEISNDLLVELKALGKREGVTLFMILLAAFKVLLNRYSRQEDIVVGTPIANRNRAELEGLIGFFVNTLVMRTDLGGDPSFKELVSRVRGVALAAYAHQDLPFEKLVEELRPGRDLSRNPLIQVLFSMQNTTRSALKLEGITLSPLDVHSGTTKFDLSLFINESSEGLKATIEYDTDLFDAGTITRMLRHFEKLLEGIVSDPERPVSNLPMLTQDEFHQLITLWNDTTTPYPHDLCLHELFEYQADKTPDAVAVVSAGGRLSYGELNRRANQLAHHLRLSGVGPESLVGVCLGRGFNMVVGLLGVLKAGGAYVPLDPVYPPARLSFMLEDAEAGLVLTEGEQAGVLRGQAARLIRLDADWGEISQQSEHNPVSGVMAKNLAYVIYTSGSTGRAKGVGIEHGSVTALLQWAKEEYTPEEMSGVLASTSVCFDLSVFEMFAPLSAGGKVILCENALHLPELSAREEVKMINTVPSAMTELVRGGAVPTSVRTINLAGEALQRKLADDLYELGHVGRVMNLYGPSEDTTYTTYGEVKRGEVGSPTIGRPISNTEVYILDEGMRPVPVGVAGELCIGGEGLARGYLRRPEMTAEKFVPSPYGGEAGARLYKTGDLARYRGDGEIEYLGRVDQQIKLRGYRIELGEIEGELGKHAAVRDSVVIAKEDVAGDKRLVAYVVENPLDHESDEDAGASAGQVEQWRVLYDEIYERSTDELALAFNIAGWNSSYTGKPIASQEMQEWLDHTVGRILSLRPSRVLEIGCGTGLLLFRIAPHCSRYYATDFSRAVVDYLQQQLSSLDQELTHVTVAQKAAHEFEGMQHEGFDCVLLNSVAQYFPSINYMVEVLECAVKSTKPGGHVFIGDVRSLPLLEAFHTSVELYRAPSSLPKEELRQRVRKQTSRDKELLIDPAFFTALRHYLPQISRVEIQLKRGRHHNELTRFRYDVIIQIGNEGDGAEQHPGVEQRLDWQDSEMSLSAIRRLLEENGPETLSIARIPNARLQRELGAVKMLASSEGPRTAGEMRRALDEADAHCAIEPEDIWQMGEELGYAVAVKWSAKGGEQFYDAVFCRGLSGRENAYDEIAESHRDEASAPKPWSAYANDPLHVERSRSLLRELRKYLGERLPEYMVPQSFVLMNELPLTPNGKLDRRALPPPEQTRAELQSQYEAPGTPVEKLLVEMFGELIGVERVSIHDNFFEMGGHSLLGTQVISRVRRALRVELPLRAMFESPTAAALARVIEQKQGGKQAKKESEMKAVSREQEMPLSFAQQRLWFMEEMNPGSSAYNVPRAVRVEGKLDLRALREAVNEVVARHEVLRTSFVTVGGEPRQRVLPARAVVVAVTDLSEVSVQAREAEASRVVREQALEGFDLREGEVFRASVVRVSEREHILLLSMHHIVSDGWSSGVLFRELGKLYEAFSDGKASPLEPLVVQYADYAVWQREWMQGGVLSQQLSYWKQKLEGAPRLLELPTDRPRPAVQSFKGARHALSLSSRLSQQLKELSQREGVTLFMTLLAAFQVLLSRYSRQDDIVVGTDVANRNRVETEGLIGFFVNLLVLRTDLSGDPTFLEVIRRVKEVALGAYEHQDLPFEKLVEELNPDRDLSRNPLVQVLFVMQSAPQDALELPGLTSSDFEISGGVSRFDLALFMTEAERGLNGSWMYSTDLFDATTLARMSGHLETLLGNIVAQPDARLSDLNVLTDAERTQDMTAKRERLHSLTKSLKSVRRKALDLSQMGGVRTEYLRNGETLPLVICPDMNDIDLAEWAGANREFISTELLKHGALLFRGFGLNSEIEFEKFALATCPELFGDYGDLPREGMGGKVYGSTPYPADQAILFHNESSHMHHWPMKIWFYCVKAAEQGGETPIVDCRKIYDLIDPSIRERFMQKGLMYVRNYTEGFDVSWQTFFRTADRSQVADYCRRASIKYEWKNGNGLRTSQVCPAIAKHPQTGEMVFFNQIQLHHVACLDQAVRESLLSMLKEEDLPRNVYYGDGSRIEESVVREISDLYQKTAVAFAWQEGDVLMINNMLVAHGRSPYVGSRKIVVAMGEMVTKQGV